MSHAHVIIIEAVIKPAAHAYRAECHEVVLRAGLSATGEATGLPGGRQGIFHVVVKLPDARVRIAVLKHLELCFLSVGRAKRAPYFKLGYMYFNFRGWV